MYHVAFRFLKNAYEAEEAMHEGFINAFSKLHQFIPLMLFLIEGYDHQEISEILEITEVASRTLVHRGKKKLQEQLKTLHYGTGS